MMKEFLIGAAGVVLAGAAVAQAQPSNPPAAPAPAMNMHDRVQTRAEVLAKVSEHFAKLDANRDGVLTKAEAEAGRDVLRKRFVDRMVERGDGPGGDPNVAFDRLDTNKDGNISRDEFAKGRIVRMEKRMVMKDGKPVPMDGDGHAMHDGHGKGQPGPMRMRMHRMGMLGGHMFDMADANKDGQVTLKEATDAAARHFDMADANRDGQVTPDERRATHRQMMEKHRVQKTQ